MSKGVIYLNQWRSYKGFTQEALAEKSKLTQADISNIENGGREITTKTILKLSVALNLSIERLFSPPPSHIGRLNRYIIDRLAHNIITGKRGNDSIKNILCDELASLIMNKLKTHRQNGTKRTRAKRWNVLSRYAKINEKYSEQTVKQILHRVDKLLS